MLRIHDVIVFASFKIKCSLAAVVIVVWQDQVKLRRHHLYLKEKYFYTTAYGPPATKTMT